MFQIVYQTNNLRQHNKSFWHISYSFKSFAHNVGQRIYNLDHTNMIDSDSVMIARI